MESAAIIRGASDVHEWDAGKMKLSVIGNQEQVFETATAPRECDSL